MTLSIVIVAYNSVAVISECLESLRRNIRDLPYEIIIVDNHSNDDTVKIIREGFPEVKIIENSRNEGFGRANNAGIKHSTGEFIAFVNADIKMMDGVFHQILGIFESRPDVGIIGTQLYNADGTPQKSCFKFPNLFRRIVFLLPVYQLYIRNRTIPTPIQEFREVEYVMGAFMTVRRKVIEDIGGGFDKTIFMYHEEMDFCYSARARGWKVILCAGERVIHYGGHHENPDNQRVFIEGNKSLLYFYWKHYGMFRYRLLCIVNSVLGAVMIPYCEIFGRKTALCSYRQLLSISLKGLVRPWWFGE